jgi:translation elongation factor EF-Tu-like GTPase
MAEDFRFKIEGVFLIPGRGTVLKGKVLAIESGRKIIKEAAQGGSVGLLISGIEKCRVKIGGSVSGLAK